MQPPFQFQLQNDPNRVRQKIASNFSGYDLKKQYFFDEILFILDEVSTSEKCDRDVARQIFQQSKGIDNKASLYQMIFKYVQNLQTSQLCLTREEKAEQSIRNRLQSIKGSKKTYVYLKLIQATVYARYSSTPSFSYKIWPSDIPPVTIVNSLNPVLNHEYTLELEQDRFSIIFYDSGVTIAEWVWPDSPQSNREGQYHRTIMTESVSFQLKINYKPRNSHPDKTNLEQALLTTSQKRNIEMQAFTKLLIFQPFNIVRIKQKPKVKSNRQGRMWAVTQSIFKRIPFLGNHVLNLYYGLILLIVIECIASMSWAMQFLDITIAFGAIGMLYDRSEIDLGMGMLILTLSLIVLIVKSVWGAVVGNTGFPHFVIILIITIAIKVLCIFLAWIVSIRKQQVPEQRQRFFYQGIDPKSQIPLQYRHPELQETVKILN